MTLPIIRPRSGSRLPSGYTTGALAKLLSDATPASSPSELTYAISDGEFIKIGKVVQTHPVQRLRTLQTGNPRTLTLLAYTSTIREKVAHRVLHRYRVRGEWFRDCGEVREFLKDWDWVRGGQPSPTEVES
jgi:hypothetical protein